MPQAQVVTVMQNFKRGLLAEESQHMFAMAHRWRTVESALQDKIELFTRRVMEDGLTPGQMASRQFQMNRYQELMRQVKLEIDDYSIYADHSISDRQRTLARAGIRDAQQGIETVAQVSIRFDWLPIDATQHMVGLMGDGSPLRATLQNTYPDAFLGILSHLTKGVALGANPQVTARAMVRDGLSQSLNHMLVITRSETMRVYRESSRQQYEASGVVPGYQRLATKDQRTCMACLMADGEYHTNDQIMDEHAQGRCIMVPVVDGYATPAWEFGPDWFLKQSPETQTKMMGPGRFAAWQDGQFDLDQIVTRKNDPRWGGSLHPTPLKDLVAGQVPAYTVRAIPAQVAVADDPIAKNRARLPS